MDSFVYDPRRFSTEVDNSCRKQRLLSIVVRGLETDEETNTFRSFCVPRQSFYASAHDGCEFSGTRMTSRRLRIFARRSAFAPPFAYCDGQLLFCRPTKTLGRQPKAIIRRCRPRSPPRRRRICDDVRSSTDRDAAPDPFRRKILK